MQLAGTSINFSLSSFFSLLDLYESFMLSVIRTWDYRCALRYDLLVYDL